VQTVVFILVLLCAGSPIHSCVAERFCSVGSSVNFCVCWKFVVQKIVLISLLLNVRCADSCVSSCVAMCRQSCSLYLCCRKFLYCGQLCLYLCCWKFVVQKVVFISVLLNVCCADSCVYSCVAKTSLCRELCFFLCCWKFVVPTFLFIPVLTKREKWRFHRLFFILEILARCRAITS
jgi:hypothetical protein